ncbi:MAG TPA: transposase [Chloroflexota bacterium]|nr:transposase [Chloroflexota bacterium]
MPDDLPYGRPSLRLETYDYTQPGAYFVTICTLARVCLFGDIRDGVMHHNDAGRTIQSLWEALPQRFSHISLDAFVVMPNHLHGVVVITEGRPHQGLGQIIGAFKSLSTNGYITGARQHGWPRFAGRLWQDNYYEHIVRSDASLERIRTYIAGNPQNWETDPERLA